MRLGATWLAASLVAVAAGAASQAMAQVTPAPVTSAPVAPAPAQAVPGPRDELPPGPAVPLSNEQLYVGAPPQPAPPASAPAGPSASALPPGPPQPPLNDAWQQRGGVDLRALDKVNARSLTLAGRVGGAVKYATLTIQVRACVVRPPDQPADSAAYLDITDARQNAPGFHGWMFSGEPGVAIMEHPIYDVRVVGCRA